MLPFAARYFFPSQPDIFAITSLRGPIVAIDLAASLRGPIIKAARKILAKLAKSAFFYRLNQAGGVADGRWPGRVEKILPIFFDLSEIGSGWTAHHAGKIDP